jgi:hypothetical protein
MGKDQEPRKALNGSSEKNKEKKRRGRLPTVKMPPGLPPKMKAYAEEHVEHVLPPVGPKPELEHGQALGLTLGPQQK